MRCIYTVVFLLNSLQSFCEADLYIQISTECHFPKSINLMNDTTEFIPPSFGLQNLCILSYFTISGFQKENQSWFYKK